MRYSIFVILLWNVFILQGQDRFIGNYKIIKTIPTTDIPMAEGSIVLKKDGRFQFRYDIAHTEMWSEGEWMSFGDTAILMSDFDNFEDVDLVVEEGIDHEVEQISVQIKDQHDPEWRFLSVIFNELDSLKYEIVPSPLRDICLFEGRPALQSLRVYFSGGHSRLYHIKDTKANSFIIQLKVPLHYLNYVHFKEEKISLKMNGVEIRKEIFQGVE